MQHSTQDTLKFIEKRYAIKVLLFINRNPDKSKTAIMSEVEGNNDRTKFLRIGDLIEAGLVEVSSVTMHNTAHLRTTEKGARLCAAIEDVLGEA